MKTFMGTVSKIRGLSLRTVGRLETITWGEVDGHPVTFHGARNTRSVRDGDQVLVTGRIEQGYFQAIAFANLTTGYVYHPRYRVASAGLLVCGAVALGAVAILPLEDGAFTLVIVLSLMVMLWLVIRPSMLAVRANRSVLQRLKAQGGIGQPPG